jgi:hypothetical protein
MTLKRQVTGSDLVAVLEHAWEAIRRRHAELPPAVLIIGSGSEGRAHGLRLGHSRQAAGAPPTATARSAFVAGEGLDRSAGDVLGTLLHEASHAIASERRLHETSRQGRYHNRRFNAVAEELGLAVEHHPRLGWSLTSVAAPTAAR